MIGSNTLKLCFAEVQRLLELALRQENFVRGEFKVTNIRVNRVNNYYESIEIDVESLDKQEK